MRVFRGCLLGLAVGDALGTTLEFCAPGSFTPIDDMHGGGPFALRAGQWTDDPSMALCLAHSLLHRQGFDAADQMNRDCNWYQHGQLSSTGACCDIGATVRQALERYLDGGPAFGGGTDPRSAGNGSLMRLAPVAMYDAQCPDQLADRADDSSRTTHAAAEALDALPAVRGPAARRAAWRHARSGAPCATGNVADACSPRIGDPRPCRRARRADLRYGLCHRFAVGSAVVFRHHRELCRGRAACRQPGRRCGHHRSDLRAARRRVFTASTASRPPGANACRMRQRLLCWQTGCTRRRQWPEAAATIQRTGTYAARCR